MKHTHRDLDMDPGVNIGHGSSSYMKEHTEEHDCLKVMKILFSKC